MENNNKKEDKSADPMMFAFNVDQDGLYHLLTDQDGYILLMTLLSDYSCNVFSKDAESELLN